MPVLAGARSSLVHGCFGGLAASRQPFCCGCSSTVTHTTCILRDPHTFACTVSAVSFYWAAGPCSRDTAEPPSRFPSRRARQYRSSSPVRVTSYTYGVYGEETRLRNTLLIKLSSKPLLRICICQPFAKQNHAVSLKTGWPSGTPPTITHNPPTPR